MDELVIRRAVPADLDALEKLENACFSDPWSRREIEGAVLSPVNLWLCACVGQALVGSLGAQIIAPEADILSIATHPDYRRKGVARALLSCFFTMAHSADKVFLEVRRSNAAAQALYEAAGFQPFGMRKSYYEKPVEDAILYSWTRPGEEIC